MACDADQVLIAAREQGRAQHRREGETIERTGQCLEKRHHIPDFQGLEQGVATAA